MILQLFRVILKTSYYRYFLQERSGRPQSGNDLRIRDMGGRADLGFGPCPQLGSRDVVEAISAIEQCGVLSAQAGSRPRERQSERPKRAPKESAQAREAARLVTHPSPRSGKHTVSASASKQIVTNNSRDGHLLAWERSGTPPNSHHADPCPHPTAHPCSVKKTWMRRTAGLAPTFVM